MIALIASWDLYDFIFLEKICYNETSLQVEKWPFLFFILYFQFHIGKWNFNQRSTPFWNYSEQNIQLQS